MDINQFNKQFELSEEQIKKYLNWREGKDEVYCGAAGGCFTLQFTITGLGLIVNATCTDGTELDLTEWEYF
jgi:hypothetical protein